MKSPKKFIESMLEQSIYFLGVTPSVFTLHVNSKTRQVEV
jgi:hypothetical protein